MSTVKKLTVTALFLALSVALPPLFHAVGLGQAFSPLHIPALACGLICGPLYGLICGALGPLLASLINGMPPMAMLLYFIPEMMAYGLFAGLFFKLIRTGSTLADCVVSLLIAMLIGRVVGGLVHGAVFADSGFNMPATNILHIAGVSRIYRIHLVRRRLAPGILERESLRGNSRSAFLPHGKIPITIEIHGTRRRDEGTARCAQFFNSPTRMERPLERP